MAKMMLILSCVAALLWTAAAFRAKSPQLSLAATMSAYVKDCGKIPGAGLGKIVPYKTVLKDGFFDVACVKDLLFNHGDKFGDQKYDYTLGEVTNVSIVHYTDIIAKEDRKEMTHETCFEFCRTVPDMLYFGLIHGRDCYCAPYFKPMAGDSSDCDEVCAAKPTQMCGGKTKSMVFEMHECADTAGQLKAGSDKATFALDSLGVSVLDLTYVSEDMQQGAAKHQKTFGKDGNPGAADLFQDAKVFAGVIQHECEAQAATISALRKAVDISAKLGMADMNDFEANKQAETLTTEMTKLTGEAEVGLKDVAALSKLASPVDNATHPTIKGEPSKQYYSLMYFVSLTAAPLKKNVKDPSTCSGETTKKPMVGLTIDECARACDAAVLSCVGYSYYPDDKFCFLFKKFTEVTYYTGCELAEAAAPRCYAKLSEFENTAIAPDASGKCKGCLRKATEAARCFE